MSDLRCLSRNSSRARADPRMSSRCSSPEIAGTRMSSRCPSRAVAGTRMSSRCQSRAAAGTRMSSWHPHRAAAGTRHHHDVRTGRQPVRAGGVQQSVRASGVRWRCALAGATAGTRWPGRGAGNYVPGTPGPETMCLAPPGKARKRCAWHPRAAPPGKSHPGAQRVFQLRARVASQCELCATVAREPMLANLMVAYLWPVVRWRSVMAGHARASTAINADRRNYRHFCQCFGVHAEFSPARSCQIAVLTGAWALCPDGTADAVG
jgi:hypothetical protein